MGDVKQGRAVSRNEKYGLWEVWSGDDVIAEFDCEEHAVEFAAAPDMLEALKCIERGDDSSDGMMGDIARAAIAKAEGK